MSILQMASVSLDRVTKRFFDGTAVVDEINLQVLDREFLVLVGPSGCGKSTTLRMLAGLETCTEGVIRIGGRVVNHVAPRDRDISMVFQNFALYPYMSVYKNLSFGLTLRYGGGVIARGLRKIFQPRRSAELARLTSEQFPEGVDGQVRQTARRLSIEHLLDRKPHQLSGGERQRVALGRAIVRNPAAFLLDEPLSNLDAKLRQQLRVELKRLHRELQATMIYVTHDQVEAMTLGDRVAVMNEGKILQVGRPLEVYRRPANLFVAQFLGSVPINLVSGTVEPIERDSSSGSGGERLRFRADSLSALEIEFADSKVADIRSVASHFLLGLPRDVTLGFRAEDVAVVGDCQSGESSGACESSNLVVATEVVSREQLGDTTMVYVRPSGSVGSAGKTVAAGNREEFREDKNTESDLWVVRMSADSEVAIGQRLDIKIDQQKMLWFDSSTGQNLGI
jgi:ABC-type sugar transport system ATPase subunit